MHASFPLPYRICPRTQAEEEAYRAEAHVERSECLEFLLRLELMQRIAQVEDESVLLVATMQSKHDVEGWRQRTGPMRELMDHARADDVLCVGRVLLIEDGSEEVEGHLSTVGIKTDL
jgi:hypothetical protein